MPESPVQTSATSRRSGAWPLRLAAGSLVLLLIVFPPFHFVPRGGVGAMASGADAPVVASFDAVAYAATFWRDRMEPAMRVAPNLAVLLAALRQDPAAAAATHAHRVGLGHAAYYFGRGTGRVTAVERSRVLVEIDGALVAIRTGPVFGNVVRDGCGLLEVNLVPGLAEFNALSAELNRLVEEQVQPVLKTGIVVGATVTFVGCAEAPENLPAAGPWLTFVPVQAEVTP